jgi:lipoprotein-releasing system permease protein
MTIVAGFNMISGLLILLFENTSTIGILKSLGMNHRAISKVFLVASARLVGMGMLAGNVLALLFCLIQGTTHLLKLDPENYYVSFVPVNMDLGMILLADVVSFIVIMVLLLIPCIFISKVDPARTVRVR